MGYALRASLWLFKFDPVKLVGSASQHKFIPDELVFVRAIKVTEKNTSRVLVLRIPVAWMKRSVIRV
jgi:hypothetical protein